MSWMSSLQNIAKDDFIVIPQVSNYEGHFYDNLKILKSVEVTFFADSSNIGFYLLIRLKY